MTLENSVVDQTIKDDNGNIVIAQKPNQPLIIAVVASILKLIFPVGLLHITFELIAVSSIIAWSLLEIFQGVNYFRRGLGLVVLVGLILWQISQGHMILPN